MQPVKWIGNVTLATDLDAENAEREVDKAVKGRLDDSG